MRAIIYERYGAPSVLKLGEVAQPPTPGPGQVLIKVAASAINPKDCLVRKGKFRRITGQRFPRVPGYDFAGWVDYLGQGVTGVAPGDEVFGMLNGWVGGTSAEYILAPADELALKPASLDMIEAASLPLAGMTALQALRDLGQVSPGQRVCINGASGGVGTLAVQIARALGAHVTAVCSQRNEALVRRLGAQEVIDYQVSELSKSRALDARFDCIFDVFGNQNLSRLREVLRKPGVYITTVPNARSAFKEVTTRWMAQQERLVVVRSNRADLEQLRRWVDEGALMAVIDRRYGLEEAAQAHEYIETKRARGKVVLSVAP